MENNNKQAQYELAAERVKKIRKFYTGIAVFLIVLVLSYGNQFFYHGFPNWSNLQFSFVFAIWGLIIAIRGIKLFFFNSDWEKDMINKELKKQNNGNY